MSAGGFDLEDVYADGQLNQTAIKRESRRFIDRWSANDAETAVRRSKRLAILGGIALVLTVFVPTTTNIADLILDAVFWALAIEIGAMTAIYYLFKDVQGPGSLLGRDLGGVDLVGLLVVLLMAYAATNSRPGRTVWRYVFKNAAFSPDRRPPALDDQSPPVVTWGLRAAGAAVVVLVADVTWYLLTRTAVGTVLSTLVGQAGTADGWTVDAPTGLSTTDALALYGVLLLVGILVAVSLSVRQ